MSSGKKIRAVIYTRFSPRPDQDESLSCEAQRDACVRYCEMRGYIYDLQHGYFADKGISGQDPERPGLWGAIDSLRRRDVLVVRWRHRLARDVYLSEVIRKAVAKLGAGIEAAEEGNGGSPDDVFIQQVLAAFAQRERAVIAARTKHAMLRHQKHGRLMGSRPPWGFREDPMREGLLIEDPLEQESLKVMQRLREEGLGYSAIGRELLMLGYTPRYSEEWSHRTIARILKRHNPDAPE